MRNKKKCIKILIIAILIAVLLTGCSQKAESQEVIIGVAWPFEANNNLFNEGIDLAVKEINEDGGINGKNLRLIKEDDGSQVVKGINIAQSFSDNKDVVAVIGHNNSFVSIPVSPIYEEAGIVMLSPTSTSPELTENGYKNIFRIIPNDKVKTQKIAGYLAEQGYKEMVVYYSDDSYGVGLADYFEKAVNSLGIRVVDRFSYYSGLDSLKLMNKRWEAFGYDGIFIANTALDGAKFIKDAEPAGISKSYFGGNALDSIVFSEMAGEAAEGTIVVSVFEAGSQRIEVQNFIEAFQKEYQKMPTPYAALGYDAVKILGEAIRNSGSSGSGSLAEELRKLENWPGVVGIHGFDEKGDNQGELVILKVLKKGKMEYLIVD